MAEFIPKDKPVQELDSDGRVIIDGSLLEGVGFINLLLTIVLQTVYRDFNLDFVCQESVFFSYLHKIQRGIP